MKEIELNYTERMYTYIHCLIGDARLDFYLILSIVFI